jgi:chromate reductase
VLARLRRGGVDRDAPGTRRLTGALPGSSKNWLDWTVGDDQPGSIDHDPVGWINVSPRGAVLAHESLRTVLGYVGAAVAQRSVYYNTCS